MTKAELLNRMDAYEIAEWIVYFRMKAGDVKPKQDPATLAETIKMAFMGGAKGRK